MLMVLAVAWAYVNYGTTPQATSLLYGIKPVIVVIIIQALWGLFKTAAKGPLLIGAGGLVIGLYLLDFNPLVLLFGSGLLVMLIKNAPRLRARQQNTGANAALLSTLGATSFAGTASVPFNMSTLFLTFLKLGSVVFGSGYVLLAFLRNDFVQRLGWLTDRQILDAVAVGQFTPGPVFTTATFIGYIVGGLSGAVLATVGIFLPSFIFVAIVLPIVGILRRSRWTSGFLDGVNVGALGLIAGVSWQLGRAAVIDWVTALLALISCVLVFASKINSAWLVLGGAAAGLITKHLFAT